MCELVYLVAAASLAPDLVATIAGAHQLRGEPADDRAILRAPDHERLYRTFKYCSCGTALGVRPATPSAPWSDREVRAHERQGWSAAKIARWKAQRVAAHPPASASAPAVHEPSAEAVAMAACVRALLAAGAARAGFVVHQAGDRVTRATVLGRGRLDATTVQQVSLDVVQLFA
jgi:hypothetical protein